MAAAFPRVDAGTQAEILHQVCGEARKVALIGLRGAGKSTIGQRAARELGCAFVQLDERVCEHAGMTLGEIFEYRGAEWYRALCVEALQEILTAPEPSILEVGGSVVLDPTAWDLLRRGSLLVWLHATPEAHLQRVRDQGDHRPMEGREDALGELIAILAERQPRYALAPHHIDTVAAGPDGAVMELLRAFSVG